MVANGCIVFRTSKVYYLLTVGSCVSGGAEQKHGGDSRRKRKRDHAVVTDERPPLAPHRLHAAVG